MYSTIRQLTRPEEIERAVFGRLRNVSGVNSVGVEERLAA
jgi:hypothetical protein